jgi:hypothetical protein
MLALSRAPPPSQPIGQLVAHFLRRLTARVVQQWRREPCTFDAIKLLASSLSIVKHDKLFALTRRAALLACIFELSNMKIDGEGFPVGAKAPPRSQFLPRTPKSSIINPIHYGFWQPKLPNMSRFDRLRQETRSQKIGEKFKKLPL